MSLNTELVGRTVMEIMETIENNDLPENSSVNEVLVIVAVTWPVKDENATGHSTFFRCSSAFPWVQFGLLEEAGFAIEKSNRPYNEDED